MNLLTLGLRKVCSKQQNSRELIDRAEHAVSYLLYVVISCGVTVATGWLASRLAAFVGHRPSHPPSPDLFSPPVAFYLRRRRRTDDVVLQDTMLNENGVPKKKRTEDDE